MKEGRAILIFIMAMICISFFVSCPFVRHKSQDKIITCIQIDTLKIRDTFLFPLPYRIIERQTDTIYIDTAKAVQDYFTEKHYRVEYEDSILRALTDITIAQNAIESVQLNYELLSKTTVRTKEISVPTKLSCFVGGGLNYSVIQNRVGIEVNTSLQIKKHQITFGYDFINQTPRLGWQYQIIKN